MFVCAFVIGCKYELNYIDIARLCNSLMWYYLYYFKVLYNGLVIEFLDKEVRLLTRKRFSIKENWLLYWGI